MEIVLQVEADVIDGQIAALVLHLRRHDDGLFGLHGLTQDALEAGAADFAPDEGVYTVYTDPDDVASVAEALTNDGYELLSAQVEMVPQNTIKLTDEGDIKNLQKMLDMFEDNEDVQNVWHNWEE